MCFILICVGMFHIFLNIFDIFIYMFDMLIDISICLLICIYIYIYGTRGLARLGCPNGAPIIVPASGPRGVIWNLVVRASYFNVLFAINSKSHEPDVIFSASILTFSCGSNGMGPNI